MWISSKNSSNRSRYHIEFIKQVFVLLNMTEFMTNIGNGILIVLDVPDDPVERGNIVGNALKEQIIGLFNRWCSSCDGKMKEQPGTMEVRALSYATQIWPLICKHAPSSAKEINAMAMIIEILSVTK